MPIPDDLDLPKGAPSEGDDAARVPLSEAITAVLDVFSQCGADLESIRHRLPQQELPGELNRRIRAPTARRAGPPHRDREEAQEV